VSPLQAPMLLREIIYVYSENIKLLCISHCELKLMNALGDTHDTNIILRDTVTSSALRNLVRTHPYVVQQQSTKDFSDCREHVGIETKQER
jgi:hypothetical protein